MADRGVSLHVTDVDEFWAFPTGGGQSSNAYLGATTVELDFDPGRLTGQALGRLEVSMMDIRGRPFSNVPLYAFNQTSSIEADDNLRLYELAYSRSFLDSRLSLRIGKLDLGQDFTASTYAQTFLNSSFSWPIMPSNDLYAQGPSAPLATPAVRLRYHPGQAWTFLLGVGDDNPVGARHFINPDDPWNQNQDPGGTRFSFRTGALIMTEIQYRTRIGGRTGTYRIGDYVDTGRFPDQMDTTRLHRTNWAVYVVGDQTLYRMGNRQELDGFVRGNWTGAQDRNQVVYGIDAGVLLRGPFGRPGDAVGLGFGMGAASPLLRRADRAAGLPGQGREYHLELTYTVQVTSWMAVQPDLQGLIEPSGGVLDTAGRRVGNAAIFGLHSSVAF
ncbi:carbohydrate porin [Gluconacetobacter tumulisoli]|uniref:Carbohydrate porin n=2 Tax=Gluconacetobacter tumulisoli TaxID=1286189 RepID=A0A7W4K707_9PROT|nr:carbohydrate porin [Gluconacetobacter tumulisoli]